MVKSMAIAMDATLAHSVNKLRPKDSVAATAEVDQRPLLRTVTTELTTLIGASTAPTLAGKIKAELAAKLEVPFANPRLKIVDTRATLNALNGLKGSITNMRSSSQDLDPGDSRLRKDALGLLDGHIKTLKGEDPLKVARENQATKTAILSKVSQPDQYLPWLVASMAKESPMRWDASNTITALFQLNLTCRGWTGHPQASEFVKGLAERLYSASNTPGVQIGQWDLVNLTNNVASVYSVLTGNAKKDPDTERKFFEGAARLLLTVTEAPPTSIDVQKKFVAPLSQIETCLLTKEGAVAACRYTAAVLDAIEKLPGSDKIGAISAQFRALGGISAWHFTSDTQGYLSRTLLSLSARLKANKEPVDSGTLWGIPYGLRGVDAANISDANKEIVAEIISQVSRRFDPWREVPSIAAVNGMVHGVSPCLAVERGELNKVVNDLMNKINTKAPAPPETIIGLGYTCAILVALSGQPHRFANLIETLWDNIESAPVGNMTFDRNDGSDAVASTIIEQAYSVYDKSVPAQLESKLEALSSKMRSSTRSSNVEEKITGFFQGMPDVTILQKQSQDGFE
jgi:hypothetical protein